MRFNSSKFFGALGLILLSSAIGLAILEFVVVPHRFIPNGISREIALMGFYAPPGMMIDDTQVNAQGFTGHAPEETGESPASTRILTLGGSTMFNRRMTERMIDAWRDVFPEPPTVVGAALRTHTTRASVIKYENYFSAYQFHYVLIYHGINDLWANNATPEEYRADYSHLNPWHRRGALLDNSMLARVLFNRFHTIVVPAADSQSNQTNFSAERSFEDNLRTLVTSVRARGGRPILMTFAWHIPQNYSRALFDAGALDYNNPTRYDYCPVELWGDVTYVRAGLERHNSIIRRLAVELDVDLIEQDELLSGDRSNFGDPVHFSEVGTDRFIENLTDFFRRQSTTASN